MRRYKQKGVFSIEMVFVLMGMTACLYFCFDLGFQQIRKSQLERAAHSLVSLLKERSLFYNKSSSKQAKYIITSGQAQQLRTVGARLLNTTEDNVSIVIESRVNSNYTSPSVALAPQLNCVSPKPLSNNTLDVKRERSGSSAPIYQVTICQRVPAWFERVMGNEPKKKDRVITAHSTFIGR
ncbi:hypothetical protein A3K86_15060 [Photobacterium jeanii]|uniref:Membrane associated secretion system protein n=1 Tax=Photobacterium jeanii TaxID=858640 RepID=A0A178K6M4_9GAMM|nr:tight adherence pilus pseudopilin TadF [Photobacterium jeanii]OAN12988.1 hypothetical protein A3K86_15060 [Photobacterium jeanii]